MKSRVWLILLAIPVLAIFVLRWTAKPEPVGMTENASAVKTADASRDVPASSGGASVSKISRPRIRPTRPESEEEKTREKFRQYLNGGLEPELLSVEQLQRHIEANNGSVESHLAAFQASGDPYWLTNAAVRHPEDPRIHFSMVSHASTDGNRREWLEKLKASDPDNALANFLSARDHFKNRESEKAIEDLLAGANKPVFSDYTQHDIQSAEEMYLASGKDPIEAKLLANIQQRLPHLKELRNLSRDLVKLQEAAVGRGDARTFNDLAQIGINIGQSMGRNDGLNYLLNDLVGIGIQKQMLGTLDADAEYPFLNGMRRARLSRL